MKEVVKSVFTLTSFTLIERALGFFFKIYLSRAIGAVGMGVYTVALSFIFVLLTLITSGIPLVVSKLTASGSDKKLQHSLASAALILELITSVSLCAIVIILRVPLTSLFTDPASMTLVMVMLPSVILTSVYSAFRGTLWGNKKFLTVSALELVEQVSRIVICIVLFVTIGANATTAAASMSLSCLISAAACVGVFFFVGGRLKSPKGVIKPLLTTSAPITLTRTSSSINSYITAVFVPFLLISTGLSGERAMYIFGSAIGMAFPLLFLPIAVVGSLAFVLIPTLSESYASGRFVELRRQAESAISFSLVVAMLFLPLFFVLGEPLCEFIYENSDSGAFLSRAAWLLVPLSVENITSSMLNSVNLEKKSLLNYAIGSAVMFAILGAFYGRFTIDVYIYAFGASLTLSTALDIIDLKRRCGISLKCLLPLLITFAPLYPAVKLTEWTYAILPLNPFFKISIAGILGFAFMLFFSFIFGAFGIDILKSKRKKSNGAFSRFKFKRANSASKNTAHADRSAEAHSHIKSKKLGTLLKRAKTRHANDNTTAPTMPKACASAPQISDEAHASNVKLKPSTIKHVNTP